MWTTDLLVVMFCESLFCNHCLCEIYLTIKISEYPIALVESVKLKAMLEGRQIKCVTVHGGLK